MIGSPAIPKTLAELFAFACAAYSRERSDDLFSSWRASLGDESVPDLYEALIAHQRNTSLDGRDGRPAGRWFPTPADLLAHIEARHRSEIAKRGSRRYCGREGCVEGWMKVESGKHRETAVARCPDCKALWDASG
jgi:hypothetical protein